MASSVSLAIGGLVVAFLLSKIVTYARSTGHKGQEPPPVLSSIPIFGHIIGLMRHKVLYYQMLKKRTDAPVFSIPILGSSIYVVASPKLVLAVQKTKSLAFEPVISKASVSVAGCSAETQKIMETNIDGSEGPRGYVLTFSKNIHPPLKPGPALDSMNRIMIQGIESSANELAVSSGRAINFFKWLQHELTMATTNAVYGPANPYKSAAIEAAFWDYEANLMMLLVNIMPSITARAGIKARNTVSEAFETYFNNNEHLNGSSLVQARYNHSCEYDVPVSDIAKFEVGGSLAVLANTFPTAYWMLIYIYSHDDVLQDCRDEVFRIARIQQEDNGTTVHSIDMTSIKDSCPVISATLKEVLRHTAVGSTVREVMEDTMLDGYLLKKGCTLLTPANVLHNDSNIWGSDTDTFDHRRFLKAPGKKMPNPAAFRAFGGGATLCPGRHFAATEVLAIATMFIARFDMTPVGKWPRPGRKQTEMWSQILPADPDFEVEVRERDGLKGDHKWTFQLTESDVVLAMAAEDLNETKDM